MAQPRPRPTSTAQGSRHSYAGAAPRPVSSFYGGGGAAAPANRDSYISTGNRSSVFYNGEGQSLYSPGAGSRYSPSAGQRNSYYSQVGQHDDYRGQCQDPYAQQYSPSVKDQEPDIYGDFNNMAPRLAHRHTNSYDRSPTANDTQTSLLEKGARPMSMAGGEIVAAPTIGNDWNADEARYSKVITEKPQSGTRLFQGWWKSIKKNFRWNRLIFILFGFFGCLAALLYFLVPRVPSFQLAADMPLAAVGDSRNIAFTRIPAVFNWNARLSVAVDGRSNWLPFHFTSFSVNLYDLKTGKKVGEGSLSGDRKTYPGREITPTNLDVRFYYRGNNASDPTWQDFYTACAHKYTGVKRPGLDFTVEIKMMLRGLIGTKTTGTTVTALECPIELPADNA